MASTPAQHVAQAATTPAAPLTEYDVARIRKDYPFLDVRPNGWPIAYLDNAATTQKPRQVIEAIKQYYESENANVHRGVHHLSQKATERFEHARTKIADFLHPPVGCEVIFTRGTTEAINIVAQCWGSAHLREGDEVLISHMEHHSNIVPWQMACERTGAKLKVIPIHDDGSLDMEAFDQLMTERVKMVGIVHISNALGTVNPVEEITRKAHEKGALVLVDGAQATPHMAIRIKDIGCDFYALSGHKMYGPTGIGILWGRAEILGQMPPYQGGGDMILSVTFEKTIYNHLPHKFEAGTPNIAGAVGLGAAVDYLRGIGMDAIEAHEKELLDHGTRLFEDLPGVNIVGTAKNKAGVISFTMDNAHPHDIGQILNDEGVAVRAGHHCAQPVMQRFGIPATTRASLGLYNTKEELDQLAAAIGKVNEVFG